MSQNRLRDTIMHVTLINIINGVVLLTRMNLINLGRPTNFCCCCLPIYVFSGIKCAKASYTHTRTTATCKRSWLLSVDMIVSTISSAHSCVPVAYIISLEAFVKYTC